MAEELTGREVLLARVEVAARLGLAYQAEARGLTDALYFAEPRNWSADAHEQATYQRGYFEGREILKAHGVALPQAV